MNQMKNSSIFKHKYKQKYKPKIQFKECSDNKTNNIMKENRERNNDNFILCFTHIKDFN